MWWPHGLQGEAEGRIPDAALYAQLIAYLCRMDDVDSAIQRLDDMEVSDGVVRGRVLPVKEGGCCV